MELTPRKLAILQAIVDEYIMTGMPIGSRTISKREDMHISPATIRNEMADLEEEGYLVQPHTSAGRIPSDKAYRLYVNMLMRVTALDEGERNVIKSYFDVKMAELEQLIDVTATALSETTMLTSVVMAPQFSQMRMKRVQIVKLTDTLALAIFVMDTGLVRDVPIETPPGLTPEYFEVLSATLSRCVEDRTPIEAIAEIRSALNDNMQQHKSFLNAIIGAVGKNEHKPGRTKVVFGGTENIFNHPEYQNVEKAKGFLQLLEKRDGLYNMLRQATDMEFTIKIGSENEIDQLKDMSVVTATYRVGKQKIGSFGVIGPTRMNYAKVISVLSCVGTSMSRILEYMLDEDINK